MPPKKIYRYRDVEDSVKWAKSILANAEDYLLIDFECDDFEDIDTDITGVALSTVNGATIFEQKLRETGESSSLPDLAEVWPRIEEITNGRKLITYNEAGISQNIEETLERQGNSGANWNAECLMDKYSAYKNVWSSDFDDYKWQKLPGNSTGSATDDCKRMSTVLTTMQQMPEKFKGTSKIELQRGSQRKHKKETGNAVLKLLRILGSVVKILLKAGKRRGKQRH